MRSPVARIASRWAEAYQEARFFFVRRRNLGYWEPVFLRRSLACAVAPFRPNFWRSHAIIAKLDAALYDAEEWR